MIIEFLEIEKGTLIEYTNGCDILEGMVCEINDYYISVLRDNGSIDMVFEDNIISNKIAMFNLEEELKNI